MTALESEGQTAGAFEVIEEERREDLSKPRLDGLRSFRVGSSPLESAPLTKFLVIGMEKRLLHRRGELLTWRPL